MTLDVRHKPEGQLITAHDVQEALSRIRYTIRPMDIVLIQTGADRFLGTRRYFTHGVGMSAEATRWILDQGVKVTGIDAWSWDGPLKITGGSAGPARVVALLP